MTVNSIIPVCTGARGGTRATHAAEIASSASPPAAIQRRRRTANRQNAMAARQAIAMAVSGGAILQSEARQPPITRIVPVMASNDQAVIQAAGLASVADK